MPFTPSHAVVALPFVRTPLVPAGVAIGAMTPDLPLFLRGVGPDYAFTHAYTNVLWTALIAFALFLLWRVLLRPAVGELAPRWVARRLPDEWSDGGLRALRRATGIGGARSAPVWLALSLVVGVLSHILWDSFTHEGRWGVDVFPLLDRMWGPLTGYKWLQYASAVVGLAVIGVWAILRLMKAEAHPLPARVVPVAVRFGWWVSLPVVLIAAWLCGYAAWGPFSDAFTVQHLAYRVLPPACAVWGAVTAVLCVLISVMQARHGQRG